MLEAVTRGHLRTSPPSGPQPVPVSREEAVAATAVERRVLLVAPTSQDGAFITSVLASAGIAVETYGTLDELVGEISRGAAAILIPGEMTGAASLQSQLQAALDRQPPWSDLPVLVLACPGARSAATGEAVRTLGNVTVLERPVQVATLLSAVRTSLRARERQIQIRELLRDREQAEQSLRQVDQRKDEFLATLGHELRNPLAPLVTGLHLLRASAGDETRLKSITSVMERQLQHLVRLVDDLMEVSRITRGLVEIRHEPLDLVVAARAAIDTSRPGLDAAGHALVVDVPGDPIVVSGDTVRLTQVFANLLTNAAKYTNSGGKIWLTVTRARDTARVSVRDNGIGIPPDQLESVFDMFMQVDRSDRRAQGGLGIGLTLVRTLVGMHGGRVYARSAGPGTGSEFVVELPVLTSAVAFGASQGRMAAFPARRLLIVDDNRDAAETLAALLTALGVTVAVANNGHEALEEVAAFAPDAVVLDIGMPGMDGYEVARRMRATRGPDDLTLIALTGWGQDADVRLARAAGFDHHLVKPPDLDRLREVLSERWPK